MHLSDKAKPTLHLYILYNTKWSVFMRIFHSFTDQFVNVYHCCVNLGVTSFHRFPLYSKGKEKFQFNYGVYLLNKNIAQVSYNPRLTRFNILNFSFQSTSILLHWEIGWEECLKCVEFWNDQGLKIWSLLEIIQDHFAVSLSRK